MAEGAGTAAFAGAAAGNAELVRHNSAPANEFPSLRLSVSKYRSQITRHYESRLRRLPLTFDVCPLSLCIDTRWEAHAAPFRRPPAGDSRSPDSQDA